MFLTAADWLELALDGSAQDCMEATGRSRTVVIARALALAQDPVVQLQHPDLVARVHARREAAQARRQKPWP